MDGATKEFIELTRALTMPWPRDEIKWRVGSMNKEKTKALPLAYVDARTVMDRLDNVVGLTNWQDRYEFHGTRTICYLSIRLQNEWLCKADGAGDSDIEGEKGGISDAFKRAAVKWGMGRELYELKCKWMPINEYKQLDGDPWQYVMNKKPEKPIEKQDAKLAKADSFVAKYINDLRACTSTVNIIDLSQKNSKFLTKIHKDYPDLSAKINQATEEKRRSVS